MLRRLLLILSLSCLTLVARTQTRDLDFYIIAGLHNSPLLNDIRNQISSSIYDSLLVRAAKKPAVEAKSQFMYAPVHDNYGYDEAISNGGNYTAVMGISQNIFNKRELDNKYKSIGIERQSLYNSTKSSSIELKKLITDQYLTAFSIFSDLEFNRSFLSLSVAENEIVNRFVKNGIFKQTDYLSLLLEIQSEEITIKQLEAQFRKEMTLLSKICGLNDSLLYNLTLPEIKIEGKPEVTNSPFFIQFKIDSLRIENERSAVDIRYRPKVNWFADAGVQTSYPWDFYRHFGYSAGLNLNIPIYDGKQRSIEKQKLEFNENSRKMYADNYRVQYSRQVEQLNDELRTLDETSATIKKQLETSDILIKALREQLEAGIVQMTDYVIAIKNYRTIKRSSILVNIQKLQVINEMNFLLTE